MYTGIVLLLFVCLNVALPLNLLFYSVLYLRYSQERQHRQSHERRPDQSSHYSHGREHKHRRPSVSPPHSPPHHHSPSVRSSETMGSTSVASSESHQRPIPVKTTVAATPSSTTQSSTLTSQSPQAQLTTTALAPATSTTSPASEDTRTSASSAATAGADTKAVHVEPVTDAQLNALGAKIVKAELMGNKVCLHVGNLFWK